jgi:hypothetical protein
VTPNVREPDGHKRNAASDSERVAGISRRLDAYFPPRRDDVAWLLSRIRVEALEPQKDAPSNEQARSGNYQPTLASVLDKLERNGALFASDEVLVLVSELDRVCGERDQAVAAMREIQRKYVRTDKA